ncbi:MAG: GatB/YqeY domain-containing protein [Chloroflexota bacterium]|nr:GatB/YqeY domain-containing protein [Chloroflexota bacterium]
MADQKQALKQGDRVKLSTLRLLRSAIEYEEISRGKELDDSGVQEMVARQVKQRHESIEAFQKGNRQDLVSKEEAELKVLLAYLPQQMGRDEVRALAQKVIAEVGARGPTDKGKVMGRLMPQVKGKAEGSLVNQVVTEMLAGLC